MRKSLILSIITVLIFSIFIAVVERNNNVYAATTESVIINEVAWMGTTNSSNDEWLELFNPTSQDIDLTDWTINSTDGTPSITLSGIIPAKGYYMLERTDDTTVPGVTADLIYTGSMSNSGESLELRDASTTLLDSVDAWYAGDNTSKASMERIDPAITGTNSTNWNSSTINYGYGFGTPKARNSNSSNLMEVVVNEIAWMGTNNSAYDEWIELYNNSSQDINLDGWTLKSSDGSPAITLTGTITAHGYYLLERNDDTSVTDVTADLIYSGSLSNSGEYLILSDANGDSIDVVDSWYAGDNTSKATMERLISNSSGSNSANWETATEIYTDGYGTPKLLNSNSSSSGDGSTSDDTTSTVCTDTTENLNNVSESEGSINVYFNKCVNTQYATTGNEANYNVNLEERLISRLNQATTSIDFATYEINLPKIVDTLIVKAAEGVDVRVIADAKNADDPHYAERFKTMRLYVEKMVRGQDNIIGTDDDIYVFSDSPMMAVEDSTARTELGLPSTPDDIPVVSVEIGSSTETGHLFVDAEQKSENAYFSPGNQMHNKFAVVDNRWVFTGSWNFTVTGLYGSETNMEQGILGGNTQHVVEINWPELANIFEVEFNEMWGASDLTPDKVNSNFSTRKTDNTTHLIDINGTPVEIYFSAGDNAVGRMAEFVKNDADLNTYFSIFAWSDQTLVDELKYKWEGSYNDLEGTLTGFDVKGVFDQSFWNQWWSASIEMTGVTASQESTNNPNIRWANPAPVYQDNEDRKLHSKTMLIDAGTTSDPTVIVGSTNWSNNGNNVNDENMLFIHDAAITNQFLQEFNTRYTQAGGTIN